MLPPDMYKDTQIPPIPLPIKEPEQQPVEMEQVPLSQDELYANVMNENRIQNLIAQISPDNQLYEIEMRIKGYKKNIYSGSWEKINPDAPEVHPLLVSRYIAFISTILNQNTCLSNIQADQINKMMKLCIEFIVDDIDANAKTYGLETDYTERTRIGYMVLNVIFLVLSRAKDGMESRRMWKALNVTETGSMEQKRGALDFMKFWK